MFIRKKVEYYNVLGTDGEFALFDTFTLRGPRREPMAIGGSDTLIWKADRRCATASRSAAGVTTLI